MSKFSSPKSTALTNITAQVFKFIALLWGEGMASRRINWGRERRDEIRYQRKMEGNIILLSSLHQFCFKNWRCCYREICNHKSSQNKASIAFNFNNSHSTYCTSRQPVQLSMDSFIWQYGLEQTILSMHACGLSAVKHLVKYCEMKMLLFLQKYM